MWECHTRVFQKAGRLAHQTGRESESLFGQGELSAKGWDEGQIGREAKDKG